MTVRDAFLLGRVSNLPTVWSNVLAGAILAGAVDLSNLWITIAALSLFYVGGMYLNDAFDRDFDARVRPERPIPSGRVTARTVFIAGSGMLIGGVLLLGIADRIALIAGLALALLIVVYDANHKGNAFSPAVMGLCRADVYVCSALAIAGSLCPGVLTGAIFLFAWVVGLTYAAKQESQDRLSRSWPLVLLAAPLVYGVSLVPEHPAALAFAILLGGWLLHSLSFLRRGDIPGTVVRLIAGISLLDALLLATRGAISLACFSVALFLLTRALQRFVPAT